MVKIVPVENRMAVLYVYPLLRILHIASKPSPALFGVQRYTSESTHLPPVLLHLDHQGTGTVAYTPESVPQVAETIKLTPKTHMKITAFLKWSPVSSIHFQSYLDSRAEIRTNVPFPN